MAQVTGPLFQVVVTEYERGYGQREDERVTYDNEGEADAHVNRVNSRNVGHEVPDTYWRAEKRKLT